MAVLVSRTGPMVMVSPTVVIDGEFVICCSHELAAQRIADLLDRYHWTDIPDTAEELL